MNNDHDRSRTATSTPLRVAIIGARGIGRHHANWWHLCGAQVAAVVGTSTQTLAETTAKLAGMFPFKGNTYTSVAAMLAAEKPDYVDICSPPSFHFEHAQLALGTGCHVLCEKPFLAGAGDSVTPADLRAQAATLAAAAAGAGRQLALCSQYSIVAETCRTWFEQQFPREPITELEAEVASPGRGRATEPASIWTDLGPHVLAAVQAVAPRADIIPASLTVDFTPDHARCSFKVQNGASRLCCRLHVFRTQAEPSHVRRVRLNTTPFDLGGQRAPDGVYQARYAAPFGDHIDRDPMHALILRLIAGNPPLPADAAVRNLDWQLAVLEAAKP